MPSVQVGKLPTDQHIASLQRELLRSICNFTTSETNPDRLSDQLEKHLGGADYRFALILDNLWEFDNCRKLLPSTLLDKFSSTGSWLLVTSRDKGLLERLLPADRLLEQHV